MTGPCVSEAEIETPDPAGLAAALGDYWAGFDVEVTREQGRVTARLGAGEGVLEPAGAVLKARISATELGALQMLRSYLVGTVAELAGEPEPKISWRGEMKAGKTFADFREVRLVSRVDLGPRLKRLVFTGEDVARFGSKTDIHVRMYFPPEGLATPEWPRPGADGRTIWPGDARRPEVRYYTVRRFRPATQEIEIDFVMHEAEGPGSAFAERAAIGAVCGMAGPVGRSLPAAGWTLLAGDETALPAIARLLEGLPRNARGAAFIEVADARDEIALAGPAGVAVRWLHRRGAPAGATDLLLNAVASAPLPPEADAFAWVACEFAAAKAIRKHLSVKRAMPRDRHLVVGYWQRAARDEKAA